jgi:putative two-component system response regulator
VYKLEKKISRTLDNRLDENKKITSYDAIIDLLSSLIEYRNTDDVGHVQRIREYTKVLLKSIYKNKKERYNLKKSDIDIYSKASTFHDIGKIAIPDDLLLKKDRYTFEEREIMKQHSIKGAEFIEKLKGLLDETYIKICYDICKSHHERWDGSGYPENLKGEQIPFVARVVAIADVYDALTSYKLYKPRLPHKTAVEMITNGECGMFDPEILECFKLVKNDFEAISINSFGKFTG